MRCECCKKANATLRVYDVSSWRATSLTQVCDSCAGLVLPQFHKQGTALPAAKEAVAQAKAALAGVTSSEIELKQDGGIAKWEQSAEDAIVCPKCGLTFKEFQKQGRLGCAGCYEAFQPHLDALLERIHGASPPEHKGRKPGDPLPNSRALARQRIEHLKREMQEAVKAENYERAAELRDTIGTLEAELAK